MAAKPMVAWLVPLAVALLSIGIFLVDAALPPRVAAGVPYVAVVLISLWLGSRKAIFITAGAATVLTVLGFFISRIESRSPWVGLEDRIIAVLTIWVTASLAAVLLQQSRTIHRERDFNKNLVEAASSIILLLDPEGRLLYLNHFTTETCGYVLAHVYGKKWFEAFVPPAEQARAESLLTDCRAGQAVRGSLCPIVTAGGEQRQFSWSLQAIRDRDGQISGILQVGQDVTSLIEAQNKVVQSERLAAIGQTITTLSHEARNELAAFRLTLRVLDKHIADDATRQLLDHLRATEGRLSRLFEDVRGYAAPICLERSQVSLADVWRAAWASLEPKHCGPANLVETVSGIDLEISVDPLRIEQVFRNLFDNSLAACTPPVLIEVSCTDITKDAEDYLQISVRDNGPGVPPAFREKVFEPFFTTKPEGTGLGMAICKRIAEAHGGDLRLSNPSDGAEFLLLLPKRRPLQDQVAENGAPRPHESVFNRTSLS